MSEPYEDHFMLCHNCGEQVERNKTGILSTVPRCRRREPMTTHVKSALEHL